MESGNVWLWVPAGALALWMAWDAVRWVRVGARGASSRGGRIVEPGKAYLRAAIKGGAAVAIPGCVAVYALGGSTVWAIAGPPFVLLLSYIAEREWARSLERPST